MKKSSLEEHTQFSRMPILRFFKENNRIAYISFFLSCPKTFEDESFNLGLVLHQSFWSFIKKKFAFLSDGTSC